MRIRCLPRPHVRFVSTQRRGQNLSERYRTLENTIQSKHEQVSQRQLDRYIPPPDTIAGFVIPKAPRAPAEDECCMSGCAVCVYDLYEDALAAYNEEVMALRAALAERDIPESEWPAHISTGKWTSGEGDVSLAPTAKTRGVVLDAFEEMERKLKAQRERRAAIEAESLS